MLASEDGRIVVLEDGPDLGPGAVAVRPDEAAGAAYGLRGTVPFDGWFSFFAPAPGAQTVARIEIDATAAGKAKLSEAGLAASAPAIVATGRGGGTWFRNNFV